jgi:hypothetical protein
VAPPSVVTMAGQSRDRHGTLPSTHQSVALTAVKDSGTNPGTAVVPEGVADSGVAGAVMAGRGAMLRLS